MVESAEEFKTLKMGDKPVRASPPRAPPGSFSSRCHPSARQGFLRRARPPAVCTRSSRPYPRKLTATPPSARPPVPRSIARALSRPRDPPATLRIAPRTRASFLNNPTPDSRRFPPAAPDRLNTRPPLPLGAPFPQLLVDFTASWCGPCKMIGPYFEELAGKFPGVVFVKVDVDDLEDVAQECGIPPCPLSSSTPTV